MYFLKTVWLHMSVASAQPSEMGTGFLWEGWRRGRYFVILPHNGMTGIYIVMSLLPSLWYPVFCLSVFRSLSQTSRSPWVGRCLGQHNTESVQLDTQSNSANTV